MDIWTGEAAQGRRVVLDWFFAELVEMVLVDGGHAGDFFG